MIFKITNYMVVLQNDAKLKIEYEVIAIFLYKHS